MFIYIYDSNYVECFNYSIILLKDFDNPHTLSFSKFYPQMSCSNKPLFEFGRIDLTFNSIVNDLTTDFNSLNKKLGHINYLTVF